MTHRRTSLLYLAIAAIVAGVLAFLFIPSARFPVSTPGPRIGNRDTCGLLESMDACGPRFLLRLGVALFAGFISVVLLVLYSRPADP